MHDYWGIFIPDQKEEYTLSEKDLKEIELMKKYEGQNLSDEEWDRICEVEVYGREPEPVKPIRKNIAYKEPVPVKVKQPKNLSSIQKSMWELLQSLSPEVQSRVRQLVKG